MELFAESLSTAMDALMAPSDSEGNISDGQDILPPDVVSSLNAGQILGGMLTSGHKDQINEIKSATSEEGRRILASMLAGNSSSDVEWTALLPRKSADKSTVIDHKPGDYVTQALYSRMLDGHGEAADLQKSEQKMVDRVKLYLIVRENCPAAGGSWKEVNNILGEPESSNKVPNWWNRKGQGESNKGVYYNQRHPYESELFQNISVYEGIALCKSLAARQAKDCPWIVEDDGKPMAVVPLTRSGTSTGYKWWFDQMSPKLQALVEGISDLKGHATQHHKRKEMLQILKMEGRLCLDNAAAERRFQGVQRALVEENDEESDFTYVGSSFMSFYAWAGVKDLSTLTKRGRGQDKSYPGVSRLIGMLESYMEDPTVKLFERHLERLAEYQAKLVATGMGDQTRVHACWMNSNCSGAFKKEMTTRLDAGEECKGGESCFCKKLGLTLPCFFELHHDGPEGRKKKREEVDGNGKMIQPSKYTDKQMDRQREVLVLVCRFWHRLVDLHKNRFHAWYLKVQRALVDALLLHASGGKCKFSEMIADESNLPGFDSHHLSWTCNLEVDLLVLETKKYSEISRIKQYCSSWEDFVENLLPELIVTRLIDSRKHKLVHLMLLKHSEFDGAEFPYKYDKERNVLVYKGKLTEEEREEIALIKHQLAAGGEESGVVKLPSATEVLKIPANGATRRRVDVKARKKENDGGDEEDEEELADASGSESELEVGSESE